MYNEDPFGPFEPTDDPEELDLHYRWQEALHDYMPGKDGKCQEKMWRRDGTEYVCNSSQSHSSLHLPIDGCCYCKHGVYRHTSYDIPCGRCEAETYEEDWSDENLAREQLTQ